MASSDHLHRLIHSLSPSEKRHLKLFAGRQKRSGGHRYMDLYAAMEAQTSPDEAALQTTLAGNAVLRNFSASKNYLADLILQSLTHFHRDNSVEMDLRET
ncbi:MAG: hypothetical protein AAF570_26045, partial [Bacteroidota bacterium]